jgi:hypothetical protein|tara:strand:- start:3113 stop:3553 length:441 start_codon:yes stop_codon:yes gene_type:complete
MSIIDTAKKLLQKAIELNDDDLIRMANALLEDEVDAIVKDVSLPEPEPQVEVSDTRIDTSQFTVEKRASKKKSQAVNEVSRGENLFVDDGTEHSDIETPDFIPTQRRGASRDVTQTCEECGKKFKVPKVHSREFFVCDTCLNNRIR